MDREDQITVIRITTAIGITAIQTVDTKAMATGKVAEVKVQAKDAGMCRDKGSTCREAHQMEVEQMVCKEIQLDHSRIRINLSEVASCFHGTVSFAEIHHCMHTPGTEHVQRCRCNAINAEELVT